MLRLDLCRYFYSYCTQPLKLALVLELSGANIDYKHDWVLR